jgi:hypothetical protein
LRPSAATLLEPASISSVYSLGAAAMIAFAWLATRRRRRDRRIIPQDARARDLSRRIHFHAQRSPTLPIATLVAIISWAVLFTS